MGPFLSPNCVRTLKEKVYILGTNLLLHVEVVSDQYIFIDIWMSSAVHIFTCPLCMLTVFDRQI